MVTHSVLISSKLLVPSRKRRPVFWLFPSTPGSLREGLRPPPASGQRGDVLWGLTPLGEPPTPPAPPAARPRSVTQASQRRLECAGPCALVLGSREGLRSAPPSLPAVMAGGGEGGEQRRNSTSATSDPGDLGSVIQPRQSPNSSPGRSARSHHGGGRRASRGHWGDRGGRLAVPNSITHTGKAMPAVLTQADKPGRTPRPVPPAPSGLLCQHRPPLPGRDHGLHSTRCPAQRSCCLT